MSIRGRCPSRAPPGRPCSQFHAVSRATSMQIRAALCESRSQFVRRQYYAWWPLATVARRPVRHTEPELAPPGDLERVSVSVGRAASWAHHPACSWPRSTGSWLSRAFGRSLSLVIVLTGSPTSRQSNTVPDYAPFQQPLNASARHPTARSSTSAPHKRTAIGAFPYTRNYT
jgi:hypothetical protein